MSKAKEIFVPGNEWKTAGILTLLIVLFSVLPLIMGYAQEQPGEVFMGVPVYVTDANNHLHLALQAKEGDILLTNKFTSENVPNLFFNPYHLLLGNTARLFGMQVITVYNIYWVVLAFAFLIVLYYFISYFVQDKATRLVAFILAGISNGLGFWWFLVRKATGYSFGSADLWLTDMNNFQSMQNPHFSLSLALLMLVLLYGIKSFEQNSAKHAITAGLLGLALSLIHLFDVITFAIVLAVWFAYRQLRLGKWSWPDFWKLSLIGAITAPGVIYYAWVFIFNPAYAAWNSANDTLTPPIVRVISGFGLVFFLAVVYYFLNGQNLLKREKAIAPEAFLAVWSIVGFILIYAPINVQRRFILGLQIPLAILAAIALARHLPNYLPKAKHVAISVIIVIIAISISTNIYLTYNQVKNLHSQTVGEFQNVKYLSSEEVDALKWIDENVDNSAVILAPHKISNFIPAATGNKIYSGHWAQTIDFAEKYKDVQKVYNEGMDPGLLPIDYVWWPDSGEWLEGNDRAEIFHKQYGNGKIAVYAKGEG
ncbi:MAG: hypothetical protein QS98_C0002G0037 [archaeon GW2011_AR3]|nr:MAG: hypothetical protein QS98_C0002G0037 [archaeon GW2011_AR3]MBS3109972.1 hypothetical protein [Candidatus Woesearchaeota archaeon]